jgi:hypothetical protein
MRSLWFVVIGLLSLAPFQYAQTSGSIAGVILDQSGSAIPGATVGLTNTETNVARSVLGCLFVSHASAWNLQPEGGKVGL